VLRVAEEALAMMAPALRSQLLGCIACAGRYPPGQLLLLCQRHEQRVREQLGVREEMRNGRINFGHWALDYQEEEEEEGYWRWSEATGTYRAPQPSRWVSDLNRVTGTRDLTGCQCCVVLTAPPAGERTGWVSRLRVTSEEAARIRGGEHPLAVILPRICARALTREELMSE
jgi:hypothetical protein